eukprot:Awhi_evm1s7744
MSLPEENDHILSLADELLGVSSTSEAKDDCLNKKVCNDDDKIKDDIQSNLDNPDSQIINNCKNDNSNNNRNNKSNNIMDDRANNDKNTYNLSLADELMGVSSAHVKKSESFKQEIKQ